MKNNKKIVLGILIWVLFDIPAFSGIEYDAGMNAYKNGQYAFAKTLFSKAVQVNAKDVNAKYMLAQIFVKEKQYTQAKNLYEEIIKTAPSSNAANLSQEGIKLIDNYLSRTNNENTNAEVKEVKKLPSPSSEPDYLANAYKNGKLYLRNRGITRIYISSADSAYKDMVYDAFDEWQDALGSALIFKYFGNPDDASIIVSFKPVEEEISGDKFGVTSSKFDGTTITESNIVIYTVNKNGKKLSDKVIYHALLHEIGHAIGILGHSTDPNDIMSTGTTVFLEHLSSRDKNTAFEMYDKYNKKPDAASVHKAKIEELQYLSKKISDDPSVFTELGDEYFYTGNFNEALEQYQKAEKIVQNKELYLKIAGTYQVTNDKDNEIVYLKKALDTDKSDITVLNSLINCYYSQKRFNDIYILIDKFVKENPDKANDPKILSYKKQFSAARVKHLEKIKKYLK